MSNEIKFTKVRAGWYATEDGTRAVIKDCTDDMWAHVFDAQGRLREDQQVGDTIDWCFTKSEAVREATEEIQARQRFSEALDRSSAKLWREGE